MESKDASGDDPQREKRKVAGGGIAKVDCFHVRCALWFVVTQKR
jgi:hypothetical protein